LVSQKIDRYLKKSQRRLPRGTVRSYPRSFCYVLPPKAFLEYMDEKGKTGSANKFPRVLKNERITEWEQFLKERQYL